MNSYRSIAKTPIGRKQGERYQQLFNWYTVSIWEDAKIVELGSGEDCTTVWMYLRPLNCTLPNSYNGKFSVYFALVNYENL